jgi:hypothetical protein
MADEATMLIFHIFVKISVRDCPLNSARNAANRYSIRCQQAALSLKLPAIPFGPPGFALDAEMTCPNQ